MTQKEKILELLNTGKWIKVQQMHEIAWRYGALLFDIRKEGVKLEKRKQKNCRLEEWRLLKTKV